MLFCAGRCVLIPQRCKIVWHVVLPIGRVNFPIARQRRLSPGVVEQSICAEKAPSIVQHHPHCTARRYEPFSQRVRLRLPSLPFRSASRRSRLSRRRSLRRGWEAVVALSLEPSLGSVFSSRSIARETDLGPRLLGLETDTAFAFRD